MGLEPRDKIRSVPTYSYPPSDLGSGSEFPVPVTSDSVGLKILFLVGVILLPGDILATATP